MDEKDKELQNSGIYCYMIRLKVNENTGGSNQRDIWTKEQNEREKEKHLNSKCLIIQCIHYAYEINCFVLSINEKKTTNEKCISISIHEQQKKNERTEETHMHFDANFVHFIYFVCFYFAFVFVSLIIISVFFFSLFFLM